jgi:hypothetical protein
MRYMILLKGTQPATPPPAELHTGHPGQRPRRLNGYAGNFSSQQGVEAARRTPVAL